MTKTEEFNQIMQRNKSAKKEKVQPITVKQIEPRDNMNAFQESLSKCTYGGNTVWLPSEILPNYKDIRTALLNAGATYKKNSFVFPNDAEPYVNRLMGGDKVNIKKEFQFFATPKKLADEMAAFAMKDFDCKNMMILEPSAGQGAIIKSLFEFDYKDELIVHAYELMDINRAVLSQIKDVVILGDDFLQRIPHREPLFDRIVANPPFSKNQDIDHIYQMYNCLKTGGRIVTIASNSWRSGSQKKQVQFREWLDSINAVVEDIEAGEFKESGTSIATCMIIINKLPE